MCVTSIGGGGDRRSIMHDQCILIDRMYSFVVNGGDRRSSMHDQCILIDRMYSFVVNPLRAHIPPSAVLGPAALADGRDPKYIKNSWFFKHF